jgi:putative NIF3 family GTP cyclohydrolase 1 type 2
MTVKEITEKILTKACGEVRLDPTCDLLMVGSYDAIVTGIVSTFIITPDVIKEAVSLGANLIITHEPTWFTGLDKTEWCKDDPVYLQKRKLLEENKLNVWRFHDHMHFASSDLIYEGLIKELGWENYKYQVKVMEAETHAIDMLGRGMVNWLYEIPQTTLRDLASDLKKKLGMNTIRYVGDPSLLCSRIGILVGGGSMGLGTEEMPMQFMNKANVDVMLCGDITEWTLCSYVHDASQMKMHKAMLILGHERTEEFGMKFLPSWLNDIIDVKCTFVDSSEPFGYF